MDDRTVVARWLGGFQVDVQVREFSLRVDEPAQVGGTNTGPQPTDLLLSAVASCFVLSLAYAAGKNKIKLDEIQVKATGTYLGLRFSTIQIEVILPLSSEEAADLIAAAERVCYVTNTLRHPPIITVVNLSG